MKQIIPVLILTASLSCAVCQADASEGGAPVDGVYELPLPQVPDSLRRPADRAAYVLLHFWDSMDWTDSALVDDGIFMEQNSANFYSVLAIADSLDSSKAVKVMLDGAAVNRQAYESLARIAELYLYDTSSPMLDEESYMVIVDRLIADGILDRTTQIRLADRHDGMMLNRKGAIASDFAFVGRDGRAERVLSACVSDADFTLLIFYDPDCSLCDEAERHIAGNAMLADLIAAKRLSVVAVCPYGEMDDVWMTHAERLPADWIVGFSEELASDEYELYELRATPTIYLLDRVGKVVAKNVSVDKVDELVDNISVGGI